MGNIGQLWKRCRAHLPFIVLCAVYLGLGLVLIFVWFQWQLNPDAASYYTIAEKYASGDLKHAINGYWGPLLSWLLVPAVWLGANLIISAKILALFTGLAILVAVYRFLLARGVSRLIVYLTSIGVASLLVEWATAESVTPDLILALLIILFAKKLIAFIPNPTRGLAIQLGVLGALMYFAKGFGFFFFLGALGLLGLWQWRKLGESFMVVLRRYLPAAIVFFILVLPFIAAISLKYNKPTINNAGQYDHHIYGPIGQAVGPMTHLGPLAPPNDTAMSVWEDPTLLTSSVPGWSPIGSWDNFGFFMGSVIGRNLNTALHGVYNLGPFVAFGISALIIGALQKKKYATEYKLFAFLSLLMIAGYSLVLIDTRYLWSAVLMALMAGALLASTLQRQKIISTVQIIASSVLMLGVTALYSGQIITFMKEIDRDWYLSAMSIRKAIPKGSNIISDDFSGSYFACHHLDLRCYSILAPPVGDTDDYYQLLKDQKITYFIDYHKRDTNKDLYSFVDKHFTKVVRTDSGGHIVTVYRLN